MIIECPNCNKKFEIDGNLIPSDGRLLQCGSCYHKWVFKVNTTNKENVDEKLIDEIDFEKKEIINILKSKNNENKVPEQKKDIETQIATKTKKEIKNKVNYLNYFFVLVVSVVALLLLIDTFKGYLSNLFPNIDFLLNNLYQSIEDIKLFILDLIK
tara:strand:+ start:865 stop:1332 length:468 start_codon:yes stop_codon:yes gene_type:complete